jgi:hypothetical protein
MPRHHKINYAKGGLVLHPSLVPIAPAAKKHANIKTTQVYDRRDDEVSFSEIERVGI